MKFSVVIPVYNTEQFLPRCLDSLKAQTDSGFEVIVVDDCSPGPCAETLRPYGDFVRYIRHEKNLSLFQARQTGLRLAKGDYVVPLDSDDYLMPETLARLRAVIERESPDIISYWMEYDDGKKVTPHWCRHPAAVVTGVEALRELVEHTYFNGVASKAFRREMLLLVRRAFEELGVQDALYINTSEDLLAFVAALFFCEKFAFLDYAGYRYFVNEDSLTFSWQTRAGYRRALEQMHVACDVLRRTADHVPVPPETRRLVDEAIAGIESWFEQTRRDSSWMNRVIRPRLRCLKQWVLSKLHS